MKDNDLFELCKEVYEKTEWDGTDKYWHILISHDMKTWREPRLQDYKPDNLFGMRIVPLYTSDYLLEKLPSHITSEWDNSFELWNSGDEWVAGYEYADTEAIDNSHTQFADTPLKSLLKLTLALHEAGELSLKPLEEQS